VDLANVLLHDVVVVEQPLAARAHVVPGRRFRGEPRPHFRQQRARFPQPDE
jgi:hypothetical protein